ncbi:hypothetical protein AZF37_08240 [endosymbiont 'TC1' of Trimyema compressum]|uniref:hypothetical protein n=1 Tax=endosymbiont 'TC1' of Trimyema compressum TaxID=243899 RepID=UPI0007F15B7B|nr:hypothetical protein [endosymbiont 'TC1' of Trimyema compressum]AMP21148.1 hypothetical protein AZF37_08240 [endosymbiont 'TC1' of Trimyema compressum]
MIYFIMILWLVTLVLPIVIGKDSLPEILARQLSGFIKRNSKKDSQYNAVNILVPIYMLFMFTLFVVFISNFSILFKLKFKMQLFL